MASRTAWLALVGVIGVGLALARSAAHLRAAAANRPEWPAEGAPLRSVSASFSSDFGVKKILLDPGHGAEGNAGNTSCFCEHEEDYTLALATDLAARLEQTRHFEVHLSRHGDERTAYKDRVDEAARFGADAFVSLHSDVRGKIVGWAPMFGKSCPIGITAPGFAILYSDEGELTSKRLTLARAVAARMTEAGFLPYAGGEYQGLYEQDAASHGVFVDRHAMDQRIFVLRRPSMPSILIETHNALQASEAERWTEPRTRAAFAGAVAAALADALH